MPALSTRLTPELVARCHRTVPETPSRYTRASEDEIATLIEEITAGMEAPLWIFAYGSLIWKPCFDPAEILRGTAPGWHRAFNVKLTGFRGTVEHPGLMMALARGGRCAGLLLRAEEGQEREVVGALLRRVLPYREFRPMVRWIAVDSAAGRHRALVFWAGHFAPSGIRGLSEAETARMIATACGYAGSCAEYLYETVAELERHGIHDRNLWSLQARVAEEILGDDAPVSGPAAPLPPGAVGPGATPLPVSETSRHP